MKAKVVLWSRENPWHFIFLPRPEAAKIRKKFSAVHKGWSSLPVQARIGKTGWRTSIFYDRRSLTYLLPLKAKIRKKEKILHNDIVIFSIEIVI